jgi:hypothetical protein
MFLRFAWGSVSVKRQPFEQMSHRRKRVCSHFRFVSGLPTGDVRSTELVNLLKHAFEFSCAHISICRGDDRQSSNQRDAVEEPGR